MLLFTDLGFVAVHAFPAALKSGMRLGIFVQIARHLLEGIANLAENRRLKEVHIFTQHSPNSNIFRNKNMELRCNVSYFRDHNVCGKVNYIYIHTYTYIYGWGIIHIPR